VFVTVLASGVGGLTAWRLAHPGSGTISVSSDSADDVPPGLMPTFPVAPNGARSVAAGAAAAGASQVVGWTARVASATGIPARPLQAYAQAELAMAAQQPGCHLSWSTLAGIGSVESNHGRHGGSSVAEDGRTSPPIFGPPLDGSGGNKAIRDTDGGVLDGDTVWDRAVGPMQFIPSTWTRWGVRASGDGARPDPQNIDDAALAAGRYLCASGRDMSSGTGWWQAVLSYNHTTEYAQLVYDTAQRYGQASLRA
jgi:membrane-bound lytic murein transglycosylase B